MRYLLDSDVLIEILRGNREVIALTEQWEDEGSLLAYSPVNKTEVFAGLRPGEVAKTYTLFNSMFSLPLIDIVGEKAGDYLRNFSKSHGLKIADALIAATAYHYNYQLATLDRRHYPMADIEVFLPI